MKNSVLIIDDDKELCALMKKCIEQSDTTNLGGVFCIIRKRTCGLYSVFDFCTERAIKFHRLCYASFEGGVFMANIHAIDQRYGFISASMLSLQSIIISLARLLRKEMKKYES